MKIKSFYDDFTVDFEPPCETPSMTVPDQSLSVRDILLSYSRGQTSLPPIETGDDESLDDDVYNYDDLVDAHNALLSSQMNLSSQDDLSSQEDPPSQENLPSQENPSSQD